MLREGGGVVNFALLFHVSKSSNVILANARELCWESRPSRMPGIAVLGIVEPGIVDPGRNDRVAVGKGKPLGKCWPA